MKKVYFIAVLVLLLSCEEAKQSNEINSLNEQTALLGACTKCGCMSWRPDSETPERCINIKAPSRELCKHLESDHMNKSSNMDGSEILLFNTETNEVERILVEENNRMLSEKSDSFGENKLIEFDDFSDMYCLTWVRDEWRSYKGHNARFSIWKPNSSSSFGCCIWVNISKNGVITSRLRVNVTNQKHVAILIGTVGGETQGVSPCN